MKITIQEAVAKLKAANKIVVTAHVNPDGDAIGSSLALMQMLKSVGKEVRVFIDDNIPNSFLIMPHADEIERPTDDMKIDADLLVILDTQPDRIGRVKNIVNAPILNIDHHVTNEGTDLELYLDANAAATCEIIFEVGYSLGANITKDVADCLYTGIATDTGFFNYANTKSNTMWVAAALIEAGVQPNVIAEHMERKSLADVKGMIEALKTIEFHDDGKVVGITITQDVFKSLDTTEGFIDLVRIIDGVDVAFLLTCKEDNLCRVSMRSRTVDVSAIARKLGGGGHIRAAGCTIRKPLEEAKKILVDTILESMQSEMSK